MKARWALVALALAGSSPTIAAPVKGYEVYGHPGRLVEVAPGRRLNLRCSGAVRRGQPTVIFESGLGFPSYSWRKVQPGVARFARVCSYDRAGLGFSDAGPMPRTAGAIASDLARLIDVAHLTPPFVLVGSSLGGQSIRLFAFRRPKDVAALVLVDPYVEGQFSAFDAIAPGILAANERARVQETSCRDQLLRRNLTAVEAERQGCIASSDPAYPARVRSVIQRQRLSRSSVDATWSESDNLDRASERDILAEQHSLGDLPIVVLTAGADFASQGYPPEVERRLLNKLSELHGRVASLSSRGRVTLVPGADHVIQASHPSIVIDTIRGVLANDLLKRPKTIRPHD